MINKANPNMGVWGLTSLYSPPSLCLLSVLTALTSPRDQTEGCDECGLRCQNMTWSEPSRKRGRHCEGTGKTSSIYMTIPSQAHQTNLEVPPQSSFLLSPASKSHLSVFYLNADDTYQQSHSIIYLCLYLGFWHHGRCYGYKNEWDAIPCHWSIHSLGRLTWSENPVQRGGEEGGKQRELWEHKLQAATQPGSGDLVREDLLEQVIHELIRVLKYIHYS